MKAGVQNNGGIRVKNPLRMLEELQIPPALPIGMVRVPARVHTLCREKEWTTLEALLLNLGGLNYEALMRISGFGKQTALDLVSLFVAIKDRNLSALRRYLPIDAQTGTLSLTEALIDATKPPSLQHRQMIRMRFKDQATRKVIGRHFNCSDEMVRLLEVELLKKLDLVLTWFANDRAYLWHTWMSGADLKATLGQKDIGRGNQWVANAIGVFFERSSEGIAALNRLNKSLPKWAAELIAELSTRVGRVNLEQFLKLRTKMDCTPRFEKWLKENLPQALKFPATKVVAAGGSNLEAVEQLRLYPGKVGDWRWQVMFRKLKAYHAIYGDTHVPSKWKQDRKLAHWVVTQRVSFRQGLLTKERIKLLDELRFAWKLRDRGTWEERMAELAEFKAKHGDCKVPGNYPQSPKLSYFVRDMRRARRNGKLSPERIAALDSVGFPWSKS